jgi:hypothetical protein
MGIGIEKRYEKSWNSGFYSGKMRVKCGLLGFENKPEKNQNSFLYPNKPLTLLLFFAQELLANLLFLFGRI